MLKAFFDKILLDTLAVTLVGILHGSRPFLFIGVTSEASEVLVIIQDKAHFEKRIVKKPPCAILKQNMMLMKTGYLT